MNLARIIPCFTPIQEIKTAKNASITAEKQRRIILAAQHYLAAQRQTETPCRFDCVLIDGETPLEWLRDAFHAC